MASGIPLVESGTSGYFGQVQPLLKVRSSILVLFVIGVDVVCRIAQNALTAYQSPLQNRSQFVQSGPLPLSPFTASFGPKAICFRVYLFCRCYLENDKYNRQATFW